MRANDYEAEMAVLALEKANEDMLAFEESENGVGDEEGWAPHLEEGSTYLRLKGEVDEAIAAIEKRGLTPRTAAKGVLALLEAVLLTTYESHADLIHAGRRMSRATEGAR